MSLPATALHLAPLDNGALALHYQGPHRFSPLSIDFLDGALAHRRQFGGGRQQDLAKACGLHQYRGLRVLDATAGLGRDAFVLASLGAQVWLCERHPLLQALLADALARAQQSADPVFAAMHLLAQDVLLAWPELVVDVVYLDPMFPARQKSAQVKKDMQLLHALLGQESDGDALLAPALASGAARVVVKRPAMAPYLAAQVPSYSLKGKAGRFDIYALRKLSSPLTS